MKKEGKLSPEKLLWLGIPVLFAAGSAMHFVFGWLGECPLAGLFAPVNESIWEHTKLLFLPEAAFFAACRLYTDKIDRRRWHSAACASLLAAMLFMAAGYYLYTGALGKHVFWADILLMFLSCAAGQIFALHVYKRGKGTPLWVAAAVFLLVGAAFAVFTFQTPRIPLFRDLKTGAYGIKK